MNILLKKNLQFSAINVIIKFTSNHKKRNNINDN